MNALLAAVLAAAAAAMWFPVRAARLDRAAKGSDIRSRTQRLRLFAAAGVTAAGVLLIGGLLGLLVGAVAAVGAYRWLSATPDQNELSAARHRRDEFPIVVDLLAACLMSGAPALPSLLLVAETAHSNVGEQLHRVAGALSVGASPDEAWPLLSGADATPIVETMCRTARTGAPAAEQLRMIAGDLRARARESAMNDARKLGVRTAGPLGLCFLPTFVLVGVVPLVVSLVQKWT